MKPIKPMLAKKLSDKKLDRITKKQDTTIAEIKYDGFRLQVHTGPRIKLYSRNLNEVDPRAFPELMPWLKKMPEGVWDGELYGKGTRLEGFNAVSKRFKASYSQKLVDEFPLQIRLFDCMFLEKSNLMDMPLEERRKILERKTVGGKIKTAKQFKIGDAVELQELYDQTIDDGLEGLVCKDTKGLYIPGGRSYEWVKLKEFDTYDLVIMGFYKGEGKLADLPFAGVVVGTKNEDGKYETITKVGLTSEQKVNEIYNKVKDNLLGYAPENTLFSEALNKKSYARKVPFAYINPEDSIVLEIESQDITRSKNWHTCGKADGKAFSLRIPSVTGIRYDKDPADCTTTDYIKESYGGE